ncbi:MAG: hypothetical protein FVQ81_16395 [Candidatus Glassbacteria bacterium]|nr:hypothetical protein [Candidatus Glassbacteria bacterium]
MKLVRIMIAALVVFALPLPAQLDDEQVPDDYEGLLGRNDITATMRGGDIEITVTAMDESIISYATVEMRGYLRKLKENHLDDPFVFDPNSKDRPIPFLVYFRALGQEVRYEPQEVIIYSYGSKYSPLDIIPVSPGFNDRVAYIREPPVSAIYLFDRAIDLNSRELSIVYFNSLSFNNWLRVIERLNEAKEHYEVFRTRNRDN